MGASENAMSLSMIAGAAFVAADFGKCVEISGENTVTIADATTDHVAGVLGTAPAAIGDTVPVVVLNGARGKIKAGGTITAGQILVPAADGEVTGVANIAALPAGGMGVGIALEAAVDGQIFEAVLMPFSN